MNSYYVKYYLLQWSLQYLLGKHFKVDKIVTYNLFRDESDDEEKKSSHIIFYNLYL